MVLAKGDRVQSHPSAPVMCVEGVHSNRRITCSWMDAMGQRHDGTFLRETLRKVEPFALATAERQLLAHADGELSGGRNRSVTRRRLAPISAALGTLWRELVARIVRSPA